MTGRRFLMRLDRGPTASFKDFAARMMARWMGALNRAEDAELVILTATSGDTGSAVAHAYHGVPRVHSVVLFPIDEVSTRQRKQMTTLGGNVTTFAVDGKFDDCQAMVKRAFADPDLAGLRLSSAQLDQHRAAAPAVRLLRLRLRPPRRRRGRRADRLLRPLRATSAT